MSDNPLKRELKRIRVDEVSVVDSPAIEETFVLVKRVSGATNFPLADSEIAWDGSAAGQRVVDLHTKDGVTDWSLVHRCFFYFDPQAAETIGGHKLGFVDVIDGKEMAIPKGLIAVAGVLQGARGGVDIPEAEIEKIRPKVAAYYKKMAMDPPWKTEKGEAPVEEDEDGTGGDAPARKEGSMGSPTHEALLKEKIAAVQSQLQALADTALSMDPEVLKDKVWALTDLLYGVKDVGTVVSLSKRVVDDKLAAGDAKGALDALVGDLHKATGGGTTMDEKTLKEWQDKAAAKGMVLQMGDDGKPVMDADGKTPVMVADPAKKPGAGQKRFTAERTQKIAQAAKVLADVLKEVGVADLNALAGLVKDGKVAEEDDAEVGEVKKSLDALGVAGTPVQKNADKDVEISDLKKRLETIENAALAKGLGVVERQVQKGDSVFKGVV